jgi:hypothetical protein
MLTRPEVPMSRRRLSAVVVAGLLAVAALAGCRFEPGGAVFIEDTSYTRADIDRIVDAVQKDGVKIDSTNHGQVRLVVVRSIVFSELAKHYAREHGYADPPLNLPAAAQEVGLPASDPFVPILASANAYRDLLLERVTPATLTDADYQTTFDLLVAQRAAQQGTFPEVRQILKEQFAGQLAAGVALRKELTAALGRYHTEINPLYLPIEYPLVEVPTNNSSVVLVMLPLSGARSAAPVSDVS